MFLLFSKLWTINSLRIVFSFKFEKNIRLKWVKILYFQSSYMWNINVLINKTQINKRVTSKLNFQKIRIPLFMFCSKFSWSCHMNLNLAILWDFAEGCILEPLARELLLLLLHIHLPIYVFQLSYLIQL